MEDEIIRCDIPRCRKEAALQYAVDGEFYGICLRHWKHFTDGEQGNSKLLEALKKTKRSGADTT